VQNAVPADGLTVEQTQSSNLIAELHAAFERAAPMALEQFPNLATIARAAVLWHIEHALPGALDNGLAQAWQDRAERCIRNAEKLVAARRDQLAAAGNRQAERPPQPAVVDLSIVELGCVIAPHQSFDMTRASPFNLPGAQS